MFFNPDKYKYVCYYLKTSDTGNIYLIFIKIVKELIKTDNRLYSAVNIDWKKLLILFSKCDHYKIKSNITFSLKSFYIFCLLNISDKNFSKMFPCCLFCHYSHLFMAIEKVQSFQNLHRAFFKSFKGTNYIILKQMQLKEN